MSINYENFSRTLPFKEQAQCKRQREDVWQIWDTNNNGFLSLQEIEEGFFDLFSLKPSEQISTILKKSAEETKKRFNIDGHFGPNYMEKRQFRAFLESLHRHIRSYSIYESIVKNNQIEATKLIQATCTLLNKSLTQDQTDKAKILARQTKITYDSFETWLSGFNFYLIGQNSG